MIGALANVIGDPFLHVVARRAFRDALPVFCAHLGVGKDAQHRRAELGGDFDPLLDPLHIEVARGLVRRGEVVADARAANPEAEVERTPLQLENELIRRHAQTVFFVAGKIIAGWVDRIEVRLGAKLGKLDQAQWALAPDAKLLGKRVGVARNFEAGTADSFDRLGGHGRSGAQAYAGRAKRQERGAFEKISAGVLVHKLVKTFFGPVITKSCNKKNSGTGFLMFNSSIALRVRIGTDFSS